jgi:hypothetical protein
VQHVHPEHHLFQRPRRHRPHDHAIAAGQRIGWPGDRGADAAEVNLLGLVAQQSGSPCQVTHVPAVAACE